MGKTIVLNNWYDHLTKYKCGSEIKYQLSTLAFDQDFFWPHYFVIYFGFLSLVVIKESETLQNKKYV